MTDQEFLEKRLDMMSTDGWSLLMEELTDMASSLESIKNIDDEKTLFINKGAVGILNMVVNMRESTKFALEQLELDV
jgi:hypothetical protein